MGRAAGAELFESPRLRPGPVKPARRQLVGRIRSERMESSDAPVVELDDEVSGSLLILEGPFVARVPELAPTYELAASVLEQKERAASEVSAPPARGERETTSYADEPEPALLGEIELTCFGEHHPAFSEPVEPHRAGTAYLNAAFDVSVSADVLRGERQSRRCRGAWRAAGRARAGTLRSRAARCRPPAR